MKKEKVEKVETTRLNKFISHNSGHSRRDADKLIEEGRVCVDGEIVTNMGMQVSNFQKVTIDKKAIKHEENKMFTVIIYNKPKGELVTKNDPRGRKIIFDTLGSKYKDFMPIGRLDYASEGVLLLTDSVDVYNTLVHSDLERIYKIKLNGMITKSCEDAMLTGLELEDATSGARSDSKIKSMSFKPFSGYKVQSKNENFSKLKVAITEGQNRELRRFFAHFGFDIMDLKRVEFGGISLNNLPTGKSRFFTRKEYQDLKDYMKDQSLKS